MRVRCTQRCGTSSAIDKMRSSATAVSVYTTTPCDSRRFSSTETGCSFVSCREIQGTDNHARGRNKAYLMVECVQVLDCADPSSLEVAKDTAAEPLRDSHIRVRIRNTMLYAQIRSAHTVNTQNQRRDIPPASRCAL